MKIVFFFFTKPDNMYYLSDTICLLDIWAGGWWRGEEEAKENKDKATQEQWRGGDWCEEACQESEGEIPEDCLVLASKLKIRDFFNELNFLYVLDVSSVIFPLLTESMIAIFYLSN